MLGWPKKGKGGGTAEGKSREWGDGPNWRASAELFRCVVGWNPGGYESQVGDITASKSGPRVLWYNRVFLA